MNILIDILIVLFVGLSLLLVLAILMQRSKQDGLGAAFGGGLTETVFGAQTSAVLVKFTSWLTGMFFFLAILLAYLTSHRAAESSLHKRLVQPDASAVAPAATPAPAPVPASAAASSEAPAAAPAAKK
ncbi:preprotein translocase subunit SecG [Verrucomicrobium sp. GAS474]|uniref:preprotein translocase subunit SecG n=1 Tax=Verrucomicrobium sp. GAS474 TaxID=1882831 RepID=UPI00087BBD3C|nr:preprotein translocase subunit SecG [Verrucomicrobium sp. GAS474]SDU21564.1 preprotein translocase subunit SecG [Verrucomicrobium sp. GAS474]